jgi:hypothetical protein
MAGLPMIQANFLGLPEALANRTDTGGWLSDGRGALTAFER